MLNSEHAEIWRQFVLPYLITNRHGRPMTMPPALIRDIRATLPRPYHPRPEGATSNHV